MNFQSYLSLTDSPGNRDFCVLSAHGGLVVLRVGEHQEGNPQLEDLVQGQRVL